MEQINFNAEAALSEIADIFNCISDTAASVREKNDEKLQVLQNDSKSMQRLFESLSDKDDGEMSSEMRKVEAELSSLGSAYNKLTGTQTDLRQQVDMAKDTLKGLGEQQKQQSLAAHPRARYSVNIFRDVSKINWHDGHKPNELKGFIRSKVGLKTFCFDREKQSNFFITNSLWEMGDDATGDENAGRGRKQGAAC